MGPLGFFQPRVCAPRDVGCVTAGRCPFRLDVFRAAYNKAGAAAGWAGDNLDWNFWAALVFLCPGVRRNNSLVRGTNGPSLGVRAWGDITMADSESWKERRNQVERYRVLARETTDPIASRLLHDIVLDLEAELEGSPQNVGRDAA